MNDSILYYCPASVGGIADYAHYQCEAICAEGCQVTMLCPTDYSHESNLYVKLAKLRPQTKESPSRLFSRVNLVYRIIVDLFRLNYCLYKRKYRNVLFATYSEYLAPLWAWTLRLQVSRGITFSAVLHDPVRSYVVGPTWWHEWSVRQGYSFLKTVFVHAPTELDCLDASKTPDIVCIPHGPYAFPRPSMSRAKYRSDLGIPSDAPLLLSFGHLRDNKNLDLIIRALVNVPNAHLLIAGSEAPHGQTHSSAYKLQADELGVSNRCHWLIGHQNTDIVSGLFTTSDLVLLVYAKSFVSASGVLNIATSYEVPVLASCGGGPLKNVVEEFDIGSFIEPDNLRILESGIIESLENREYDWTLYLRRNSWEKNALAVIHTIV